MHNQCTTRHFTTFDGRHYSFPAEGAYYLAVSGGSPAAFRLQPDAAAAAAAGGGTGIGNGASDFIVQIQQIFCNASDGVRPSRYATGVTGLASGTDPMGVEAPTICFTNLAVRDGGAGADTIVLEFNRLVEHLAVLVNGSEIDTVGGGSGGGGSGSGSGSQSSRQSSRLGSVVHASTAAGATAADGVRSMAVHAALTTDGRHKVHVRTSTRCAPGAGARHGCRERRRELTVWLRGPLVSAMVQADSEGGDLGQVAGLCGAHDGCGENDLWPRPGAFWTKGGSADAANRFVAR